LNDLLDFAHELARTAGKITGHQQNDWLILAQTSGTTDALGRADGSGVHRLISWQLSHPGPAREQP
jgi:hypothetical protein